MGPGGGGEVYHFSAGTWTWDRMTMRAPNYTQIVCVYVPFSIGVPLPCRYFRGCLLLSFIECPHREGGVKDTQRNPFDSNSWGPVKFVSN